MWGERAKEAKNGSDGAHAWNTGTTRSILRTALGGQSDERGRAGRSETGGKEEMRTLTVGTSPLQRHWAFQALDRGGTPAEGRFREKGKGK